MSWRNLVQRHRRKLVPSFVFASLAALALVFRAPLVAWFTLQPTASGTSVAAHQHHPHEEEDEPEEPVKPEAPALTPVTFDAHGLSAMQKAFEAYERVRTLLAADRVDGLAAHAGAIAKALEHAAHGNVPDDVKAAITEAGLAAGQMGVAEGLDTVRLAYGELSRFLIALAVADTRLQEGWHVFQCPMAEGFERWFQRSSRIDNPYMGPSMLMCGWKAKWKVPPPEVAPVTAVRHEGHDHDEIAFYTCPMHPSVRQPHMGICPLCAMDLAPVTKGEVQSGVILVDEGRRQRIGVRIGEVDRGPLVRTVRAVGRVTWDERGLRDVTLKVQGWITRLHVNTTGQPVKRGQLLFEVYSPELYAAQQEFLQASRARGAGFGSAELLEAARERLRLWDLSDRQIDAIAMSGKPLRDVPFFAPANGFVLEKNVVEGAAVQPGQQLFRIAATDRVWVETEVYEADYPLLSEGQTVDVTISHLPGRALEGTVSYIYPYLDPSTRTGRIRVELPNPTGDLKPEMFADVSVKAELGERLRVPVSAVLYTGPRRLVFIDLGEGRLRPQEVKLGVRAGDYFEVLEGLEEGQEVVTSGNFLIASESRLRSAAMHWEGEHGAH